MNSNTSAWINFFSVLGYAGAFVVIVGVMLEGSELLIKLRAERKFLNWINEVFGRAWKRKLICYVRFIRPKLLRFETLGFSLLVVGLVIELTGSWTAERMQSKENSDLEATNQIIQLQIELVHSNNLVLERQLQPRTISTEQIKNFVFLTEKISKIPIKIKFSSGRNETVNFAYQIRNLFDKAFFPADSTSPWNIEPDNTVWARSNFGDKYWPDVVLFVYGTNQVYLPTAFSLEITNGFERPVVINTNAETIKNSLLYILKQVGIRVEIYENNSVAQPNENVFYVLDKAN